MKPEPPSSATEGKQPQCSKVEAELSNRDYIAKNLHNINPETDFDDEGNLIRREQPPAMDKWECPECHTRYIKDIGKCGDLQGCSRPNVVPVATDDRVKMVNHGGGVITFEKGSHADEWTVHWSKELDCHVVSINDATKALAAERDRNFTAEKELRDEARTRIEKLKQQLAAERIIHDNLHVAIDELRQQLLAAQAAIAETLRMLTVGGHTVQEIRNKLDHVDLSALDKHDDELLRIEREQG